MKADSPRPSRVARTYGLALVLLALLGCGDSSRAHERARAEPEVTRDDRGAIEIDAPPMNVAASDARVRAPMDATPSPDGERVYYTALERGDDGEDVPGVFAVAAQGGEIETLARGGVLTAPVGISVSLDGERLFLADAAAGDERGSVGAIVSLGASGGEPVILEGTAGYAPRGLTIARIDRREELYFTGRDPETGRAGVFRVASSGGTVETLSDDAGLVDPAGIAVGGDGAAYVVDAIAAQGLASVVRVRDGRAETMLDEIGVGFPAGIALTRDGTTLLVSALDPRTRRDRVYVIDTESLRLAFISEPFANFTEPAGLHRAHDADVFAWADSEANDSGTVYVLAL
jgi:DNA-binding beta-propeller fold protein YncE